LTYNVLPFTSCVSTTSFFSRRLYGACSLDMSSLFSFGTLALMSFLIATAAFQQKSWSRLQEMYRLYIK